MKKLWKFCWDDPYCFLGGLFVATDKEIENIIGRQAYFGEVGGKHSEIYGIIEEDDIELVTTDQRIIETIGDFGLNPLFAIEER